jgi:pheromone shutdown protein TraB
MVDRLLKLSKDSSSIVAIVGRNHLPGMIRLWQKSNEYMIELTTEHK